ncbi:MAG: tRNA (adenosine(37)-N6)-threonylcarbamoyltransferase complex transferase subunit TsaD [Thermodesulfovibrio sp.]|jgi:N6-L-threonylcarbamoyladenine synthase|uniref:tRNA (adenosine(37)-N6)-threonylcarbamoyltransferase complex transferase subunit TsaD n=1 Tax=unclassified Thermodesulfovibrio TaxID=2645936 RepID=UPI00083A670E|nr:MULTISPECIES: tRNA (adenosine(37)-N6)-threonylcarbamoyltransferase complex transferase subunit TsaD [unclassified Thermodesulfovibrio]MDI1471261.1 tRNA (adenosine(37)-N6)-threonylcarbamoyltransferase complex transferase subunit TsaD [Thermodesulfovibrio sp. 1176]MDI6714734.1 tRNA (adenosine(37)-N6)-threonylcarbamoyltransferase complex transferase subunit TsaD [Thermodesulfovibrio sp.]ODA43490.1 TsaD/Kae1/Qri7 protein, required for threonylcarbamoyladenosine t(6)A37 formation in tRNA [Thermode
MIILGIDTSCDDTSVAVLENRKILSNIVSSQIKFHSKYGGIVPEIASRKHIEWIWNVTDKALEEANVTIKDIELIAVCNGPGLIGSLLVGLCFAKALSYASEKPIIGVNHLEGHIQAVFLEEKYPDFPFLCLIVSGGHTSLYRVDDFGKYKELGRTRDDAAGEAYDKVAKMLGLGYPGGPVIDFLAKDGNPEKFNLPRPYLHGSLDFSFSGLKTAVKVLLKDLNYKEGNVSEEIKKDIAASFQDSVIDVLIEKIKWALDSEKIDRVVITGGVAANSELRKRAGMLKQEGLEIFLPSKALCTDNAAMIAIAGYHRFLRGERSDLYLNAKAYMPL